MSRRRHLPVSSGGHASSVLVAALSAAFGVVLLLATGILSTYIAESDLGEHGSVQIALLVVAAVFIVIAVYVSAIVTTNTFATIVAGRTRSLALLRLVGADARTLRHSVAAEGLHVGVVGALIGTASGYLLVWIGLRAIIATGVLPEGPYPFWTPTVIAPPLVVVLTTWASSWIGSRAVLGVTPLQAVGNSLEAPHERAARRRTGSVIAVILLAIGALLLAGGVVLGLVTPLAMLIALVGGVLSFTGLILGAEVVMPPVLRMIGLLLGSSAPARLAAQNALRHPQRSSRTAIGLVIGVTLVTMFVVAAASYQDVLARAAADRPRLYAGSGMDTVVTATVSVFSVLVGFSALIAAVGMVNNLSLSVMQRSRELGLLRALGFTVGQVRRLVLAESAQIVAASVVSGVVLGVLYGWAGAQSLLGSLPGGGLFAPSVPWMLIVIVFIVATVLATGAAIAPTRRAVTVSPVRALAVE